MMASHRLDKFPEIPTMNEAGLPGYEVATWYGFVVRQGTSPEVLREINRAFNQAIEDPAIRIGMDGLGIQLIGGTADAFAAHIHLEMDRWAAMLRKTGIRLDNGR